MGGGGQGILILIRISMVERLNKPAQYKDMSFAELKHRIAKLSAADRLKLSAFLVELEEQNEPAFRQEVNGRMKAMDMGKKVPMEQFEQRKH
jgi:hypothetical protein